MMTNVMVKTCLKQKIIKNSNLIQAMKNSVCPSVKVIRRRNFSESWISPSFYRMFRSMDWTHDMIIVKWHDHREVTFIRHERKLWLWQMRHRFNPRKRVNDYQRYSMLLFCRSCLCVVRSAIHLHAKLQATIIFASITIHWALRRYFVKFFVYLMMTNVMVKTCHNQKIIKNSNLIRAMKNSVYPKAKVIRKPNFFESRICPNICPNIYRMFRSVDWRCGLKTRHDNRELRWSNTYSIFLKAEFVRIFTQCPVAWLNTRHDNREVALIHLIGTKTLRSDKCATGTIHTNGSMTINNIPC